MKVSSLLAMPRRESCFAGPWWKAAPRRPLRWIPKGAAEIARRVLERLGVAEDHLEALSTLPAEKILEASRMETGRELGFEPVADGKNARYNPERSFLPDPERQNRFRCWWARLRTNWPFNGPGARRMDGTWCSRKICGNIFCSGAAAPGGRPEHHRRKCGSSH